MSHDEDTAIGVSRLVVEETTVNNNHQHQSHHHYHNNNNGSNPVTVTSRDVETGPTANNNNNNGGSGGTFNESHTSSTLFKQRNQIRFHHLAAATGLIVTYFIETIVQIFLIVHCCRPFIIVTVTSWDWSWFLAVSFLVTSCAVTIVSIVWVCRGLDFAGRLCGRLLCYVMHSLLLGLLWRFLKLAFVYDRADVQEFVALRVFQAYFQSLPLTAIHMAWLINSQENWSSLAFGIVLVEFLSVVTALVLSSYIKSDDPRSKSNKGEVMEHIVKNLHCSSPQGGRGEMRIHSEWLQLLEKQLMILSRALLLCSRLFVVGIIIFHLKYWTCLFIFLHFMLSFSWISLSVNSSSTSGKGGSSGNNNNSSSSRNSLLEEMEEGSVTRGKGFVTLVTECSYILFWDVTSLPSSSAINLWTWILPVLLVLLENATIVVFHWHKQEDRVVTIISGTCLLLGWLLFSLLNFIKSYVEVAKCCAPPHPAAMAAALAVVPSVPHDKEVKTAMTKNAGHPMPTFGADDPPTLIIKTVPETVDRGGGGIATKHHFDVEKALHHRIQSDSLKWTSNSKKIPASWDLNTYPTALPNNYHNINEKLLTTVTKADTFDIEVGRNRRKVKTDSPQAVRHRASPPEGTQSNSVNPSRTSLVASTAWVPDTCCNDSNGSSNSRNTNTIRDTPGSHDPDLDNDTDVDNPNFVFYFPTDTSGQQSVTSARFQKCNDRSSTSNAPPQNVLFQTPGQYHYHHHHHHNHQHQHPEDSNRMLWRKPKKKSLCSSSASSFRNGVRRYRTSTPIEIKKAARIPVNAPNQGALRDARTPNAAGSSSACFCHGENKSLSGQYVGGDSSCNKISEVAQEYEKLIEDSYGILICEDESTTPHGMCLPIYGSDGSCNNNPKNEVNLQVPANTHGNNSISHLVQGRNRSNSGSRSNKKLKVLCAKCLQNHDPLLTNCLETDAHSLSKDERSKILLALGESTTLSDYVKGRIKLKKTFSPPIPPIIFPTASNSMDEDDPDDGVIVEDDDEEEEENEEPLASDTTDYPSETEMTYTLEGDDQLSVSTNLSTATYTTWPHPSQPNNLSMWTTSTMMPQSRFPKEFTSLEYVRTWLLTSQARLRQQYSQHEVYKGRVAKNVYRSNTVATPNRKVRFVGAVTKDACVRSASRGGVTSGGFSSKRRQPEGSSMDPLQLYHVKSSHRPLSTSLSLQPPPKQKQHPLLPQSVMPHHKALRTHTSCRSRSHGIPMEPSDVFYKDVEIIL